MAGRGRGGKSMSLNVEALGFGRGDALPSAMLQPPPLYPPLEQQPLPLEHSEKFTYLIDLKRDFQTFMEDSSFYIKVDEKKNDIVRYTDKYKVLAHPSTDQDLLLMSRMPEELQPSKSKKGKGKSKAVKEKAIESAIKNLGAKEVDDEAEASDDAAQSNEEKSDDDEEQNDEEDLDEEEMEEENDYIMEYFDNGEQFGDADDDGDDGPVY